MSRPNGQLERSLAELTIGVAVSQRERQRALDDSATAEYEQQVKVPFSGKATSGWGIRDPTIAWELPFLYAPLQRRVPFERPHFTHGVEFAKFPADIVLVHVHLLGWNVTEENWCTGATVRIAVCAPNVRPPEMIPYSAVAHLSFQGYATYAEGDEFDT